MDTLGGFLTAIAIFALYFLPSLIVVTKEHPEKTLIFALNFFLGWTVICWFIALYMSLSRRGVEDIEARQAVAAGALKGQYEAEINELRRKNNALQRQRNTRPATDTSQREVELANREAELDRLKTEYEERLKAVTEQQQSLQEQERQPSATSDPKPEPEPTPAPHVHPARSEYEGEALYVVVPSQFQRVVAETLERRFDGEDVRIADDASSRGIDIRTFQSGGNQSQPSAIVQCQLQSHEEAVEYRAVSDLLGSMSLHGADRAYLITTGSFSDDAERMITGGTMQDRLFLIDGMTFNQWRTQSGLAPVHYLSLAG